MPELSDPQLIITPLPDCLGVSIEYSDFPLIPTDEYWSVEISVQHNCCADEVYSRLFEDESGIKDLNELYLVGGGSLTLNPGFFLDLDEYSSGIWTVKIRIEESSHGGPGGPVTCVSNCIFLDCDDIKCEVAKYLAEVAQEKTAIHMAYFGLINANDCPSKDCQAMCDVYEYLLLRLNDMTDESCLPCS